MKHKINKLSTAHGTGTEHDFQLFKRSQVKPLTKVEIMADKGSQGIKKIHNHSYTPIKKRTATQRECVASLAKQDDGALAPSEETSA